MSAGLTSVVSQVILLRELLVASYGNELSLGLALGMWLLLTACGSALAARFAGSAGVRTLAVLQVASAVCLSCALFLVRSSRLWLGAGVGEALGPPAILAAATVSMVIFCPISGAIFSVGSGLWSTHCREDAAQGCNAMYLFEAAGSAIGGVVASFVLLRSLDSFQIALLLLVLNLACAAWLGASRNLPAALITVVLVALSYPALLLGSKLNAIVTARNWRGFHLVETRTSRYGSLAVIESEDARTLLQNGMVLFTAPDPLSAEESVHFAMLEHPLPRTVLLLGGGLNGSIDEVLKHPSVERVDFVELDPAVLESARHAFPSVWRSVSTHSKVHAHRTDGRLFLKEEGAAFDVVVVSLPEPQTAQINRYYTREFFEEASARLTKDGVISLRLTGGEEYRSPERTQFLRSIHATLHQVFERVVALPGETVTFIASRGAAITTDPQLLIARLRERNVHTEYVSEYFLPYRMSPERVASLREELPAGDNVPLNQDFRPIAYYYDVALWGTQFSHRFRSAFNRLAAISFETALLVLIGTAAVVAALCLRTAPARMLQVSAVAGVGTTGLTLMGTEILLLLGFQVIHGYVFEQLALIVAAFMAGMALGAWMANRWKSPMQERRLLALQATVFLSPIIVTGGLMAIAGTRQLALIMIPLLALAVGYAGGAQFSTAARLCVCSPSRPIHAGTVYALDLVGASLGAITISVYLLPVFGFARTAALLAAANLAVLIPLAFLALRPEPRRP